jgi:carbon-monoxide dehydrogenase catalytic subunit
MSDDKKKSKGASRGKSESSQKTVCAATQLMIDKAAKDGVSTVFDRVETIKPCPIGAAGSCCKNCAMGPCRVQAPKKSGEGKEEKEKRVGVCGATAETIAARNFVRMVAAGTSAHSDHARGVAHTFLLAAKGEAPGFGIKDEQKLLQVAMDFGIDVENKSIKKIAIELGEAVLAEFGRQEGETVFLKRAPLKRQELWHKVGVAPRGIDREIVELMHRTHMGVDQDYRSLLMAGARCSLADGWGGSMISTELQDIMFGNPVPVHSKINLGVLREEEVNIVVHGHEPLLPEMLVAAVKDPELQKLAEEKGAKGINLVGMCCSANEILMRHGISVAGNFLQQELAIVTGAVDAMTVDVQCQMQSLAQVAQCYHTKLITTSPKAKITGAVHIEFDEHDGLNIAKKIVKEAIENFPNRKGEIFVPKEHTTDMIAGFSHETINYLLGGIFRSSYRPLNDNIINGRIRGVAGVVGCNNARTTHDDHHLKMIKELIKNDVIVLSTGCSAMACGKAGLLTPEAARIYAGEGLASVCEAVGIPPVLHMGACVDNSRILMAATAMVKEGGLGDDISDLPAAGAAPEWMSEKAIAIGQYFVASGVFTVFGTTWPTIGSEETTRVLFEEFEETLGGKWAFEPDPIKAAHLMIAHIDSKRKALGIDKARERVLYDMAMRRELESA